MQGVIALEKNLSNLGEVLEQEGYKVIELDEEENVEAADAVLVSGADTNLLNMQDAKTDVPVINVAGKTPAEVIDELSRL